MVKDINLDDLKILTEDKESYIKQAGIPEKNLFTADNANEIKNKHNALVEYATAFPTEEQIGEIKDAVVAELPNDINNKLNLLTPKTYVVNMNDEINNDFVNWMEANPDKIIDAFITLNVDNVLSGGGAGSNPYYILNLLTPGKSNSLIEIIKTESNNILFLIKIFGSLYVNDTGQINSDTIGKLPLYGLFRLDLGNNFIGDFMIFEGIQSQYNFDAKESAYTIIQDEFTHILPTPPTDDGILQLQNIDISGTHIKNVKSYFAFFNNSKIKSFTIKYYNDKEFN